MEVAMSLKKQNENLGTLDKEGLKLESELESDNRESLLVGDDGGQMSSEEKEALERRKMDAFLTLGLFSILVQCKLRMQPYKYYPLSAKFFF